MGTGNPIIVEKDIFDLLKDAGYFTDWVAKFGILPDENDHSKNDVICINSYSGMGVDTNSYQRPNFQIVIRSNDYLEGREKAQNILDYLMNFEQCLQKSFTINGHFYVLVFPLQTAPEFLGYDTRNRSLFSFNFNAIAQSSESALLGTTDEVLFGTTGDVLYGTTSGAIDA